MMASNTDQEVAPLLRHDDHGEQLSPRAENSSQIDADSVAQLQNRSRFFIFMLVLGLGGLQLSWAVEMSNGSPYLQSLGISKALLSLVWIAGPVSGFIMQPFVGVVSDNCRSRWGKRRPFIWAGSISTVISLLLLAWARETVQAIASLFGASAERHNLAQITAIYAVVMIYLLDFAVNMVQAALRAYIIDSVPSHQQQQANAAAAILTGLGNIISYLAAEAQLPRLFWFLGRTQFQILSAIAVIFLCLTIITSTAYISERDARAEIMPRRRIGLFSFFKYLFYSARNMPIRVRQVCIIQFFNWVGWFPFLFYITTYIGQLYVNPIFEKNPNLSKKLVDRYFEEGTRVGSLALLIFAITSFVSSLLVPLIVRPSQPRQDQHKSSLLGARQQGDMSTPSIPDRRKFAPAVLLDRLLDRLAIEWLTLRRAWLLAQVLVVICMFSTFFITSPKGGIAMAGVLGLGWALTQWAPFALISAEISALQAKQEQQEAEAEIHEADAEGDETEVRAGVILGIHNVAITSPQVLAALVGSVIFQIAQKDRGEAGDESTAWVLRFGGLMTIAAVYVTYTMPEPSGRYLHA